MPATLFPTVKAIYRLLAFSCRWIIFLAFYPLLVLFRRQLWRSFLPMGVLHEPRTSLAVDHRIHVRALLGTTNFQEDHWMATDFVAIHEMIRSQPGQSQWLCGTSIRSHGKTFLMGDPACDRIVFEPPDFEEVLPIRPSRLKAKFLHSVQSAVTRLSSEETLVIVLVGHGSAPNEDDGFIIGSTEAAVVLEKEDLEDVVCEARGNVVLINTACFSGRWHSVYWTLLAAAEEEALSIVQSDSEEFRGGIFTNALLAQRADEFNIVAPCSASLDDNGRRGPQCDHDFGPNTQVHAHPRIPVRSLMEVLDWMHDFRTRIGRQYTVTDFVFSPCLSSVPHNLPLAPLENIPGSLQYLRCVPPSCTAPHVDTSNVGLIVPRRSPEPPKGSSILTAKDEDELMWLVGHTRSFPAPNFSSEIPVIMHCTRAVKGKLDNEEKSKLLKVLRERQDKRKHALQIAVNLGWVEVVQKLGDPFGKQMEQVSSWDLRRRAEVKGCKVKILYTGTSISPWNGAAGWLARIWEAAGEPVVSTEAWAEAIQV